MINLKGHQFTEFDVPDMMLPDTWSKCIHCGVSLSPSGYTYMMHRTGYSSIDLSCDEIIVKQVIES